jgi:putative multicomponent Na+:H+ antiporter subunit B
MNEPYVYIITALMPISAFMLIIQVNPYNALVIQGILGAVAALVFAVLGAADVALTQALMGTFLAVTLYAIAVRSSLVMRLGVISENDHQVSEESSPEDLGELLAELRQIFKKHYMRLELVPYTNIQDLEQGLLAHEIHATCIQRSPSAENELDQEPYHTVVRVRRIYEIMQAELASPVTILTYFNTLDSGGKH